MTRVIWDIPGGIHPAENKVQTCDKAVERAPLADHLILPLQQHIGAPAKACVSVGDKVLKGQCIATAAGFVSSPVHAPTSGTISAIGLHNVAHPSGMQGPCIHLEVDHQEQWCELQPVDDFTSLEPGALVKLISAAGIAGMGGAGFPTAVKLSARPEQKIKTLIINGTECEPYITADDRLMRERSEEIKSGIAILRHILKPDEVLIGVEDNKPEAIEILRKTCAGDGVEVVVFPTKFPSGGEKQLIQILTGHEVPSGRLPADLGIVCQNVGTTAAISRAIIHGEPLISRITTLTGAALDKPCNLEVLIGTPIQHLLTLAELQEDRFERLIAGGPMMGFTLDDTRTPVVKTTNCLIATNQAELAVPGIAQACIRCGECAEVCPVNLLPQQLYWYSRSKDHSQLQHHNLFDCIECGSCSYVCPSSIPLVQYYRASKADIRAQQAQQQKAEQSKVRFEAREARLAKEAEEKAAKRKANMEKAAKLKAAKDAAAAEAPAQPIDSEKAAKALKIQQAMIKAQIKKAERKLASEEEVDVAALNQNIVQLKEQLSALEQATPAAPKTTEADTKALKIRLSMAKVAVKKAQKALDAAPETERAALEAELKTKQQALEEASKAAGVSSEPAKAKTPSGPQSDELKAAKIKAAMAKAALKKAERAYAAAAEKESADSVALKAALEPLQVEADATQKALDALSATAETSSKPAAKPAAKAKAPYSDEQKKLKIRQAMAKAAHKKAQRALDDAPEGQQDELKLALEAASADLAQADAQLKQADADA